MFYRQRFNDSLLQAELLSSSLEDINMRLTLKALVLTSAAVCATAAFAANQARVDVPFSFTAKGQTYPAGVYSVAIDQSREIITLESHTDTAKQLTWIAGPSEPGNAPAVVSFDQVGTDHALRTVQLGDRVTPNLDSHRKGGIAASTSISGQ
jgi:hypothetical protein